MTRLLRHYHYITTIITFLLEGGVWVRESSQCIIKRHLFLRHCIPLVQIEVARPSCIALVGVAPPDYFLSCCFLCKVCSLVSDALFDTLTRIFRFLLLRNTCWQDLHTFQPWWYTSLTLWANLARRHDSQNSRNFGPTSTTW